MKNMAIPDSIEMTAEQLYQRLKNAVILAHSYVSPEIIYGVSDFTGDSLFLSQKAVETQASAIVFAAVRFMGETAKILNPGKRVFLPAKSGGCSLADSITAGQVRTLRNEFPDYTLLCQYLGRRQSRMRRVRYFGQC